MRAILRNTVAPISSLFIIMLGSGFFNTFMSLRVSLDGWSNFMTGFVYAAYYAGMMTGSLYTEKLITHTGHIRGFSIFASLTACFISLQSFFLSPYVWVLFRFLTGLVYAGLFVVIESWLLLLSSTNTRGTVLSIYMIALYTGQSLAQYIVAALDIQSIFPFNLAVVFCTLSIIPVCLMRAAAPSIVESEYINIFYIFKKVPLGFLGNLTAGLIISSFYALGPVFARENNYSLFQTSLIMSMTIFGGMALQWPIGFISDLCQRRKVIIAISLILSGISTFLFIFDTLPFWGLILALVFYGGFSFTLYPVSITFCCDFFSAAGITSITSAALIIYGIGCVLGPVFSPIFMYVTKASGLFLYSAILSLALAIYGLWRAKTVPPRPEETKEPYQSMPNLSTQGSELDPRSVDPSKEQK